MSDDFDFEPDTKHRSTWRAVAILVIAMLAAVALLAIASEHANADDFELPKPSCYFDNIDYRYTLADGPDAIVWWCSTPTGMEVNYRAGEVGGIREFLFRIGGKGRDLWAADRQIFMRPVTIAEGVVGTATETASEPRCVFAATYQTTQVLSASIDRTIGPARVDADGKIIRWATTAERPSCWSWIVVGSKRWCSVTGLLDTQGRMIGPDSYVACRIVLAPESGWVRP